MLRPYIEDGAACQRITLVKGTSFAPELSHLQGRIHVTTFDKVFRSGKAFRDEDIRESFLTPPASDCDVQPPLVKGPAKSTRKPRLVALRHLGIDKILENSQGHRIDAPLNYAPADWRYVKSQKLCYQDHLLGWCPWESTPKGCQLKHGAALTDGQIAALISLARRTPCSARLACRNTECLSGHRCVQEDCPIGGCRFPPEMHSVDTRVAN